MKRPNPIKPKTGPCLDCGRETRLIAGRCQYHYWKHRNSVNKQPILKPHKPISPVSTKQKQRLAKYALVRAEYLAEHPYCEARLCRGSMATEIHHRRGRVGDLLTDKSNFLAVCRACHTEIEFRPEWAKEMGFSGSRLKTEA